MTIIQETPMPEKKKSVRKKEASLVTAGEVENLNFRFTMDSLTDEVDLLHLLLLTCHYEDCEGAFCSKHGTFRAVNPACRKNLDESDMFMPYVESLAPINFLRVKCLEREVT